MIVSNSDLAYSILLNFLICSQLTAKIGSSIAVVRVGIGGRVGIGASSGKDVFRPS